MIVLSLFDGLAGARIALERAGIKVDKYFASEIDKYAIQIALKNYPDIIQLGDIKNIKGKSLPKIDLIIGGSPCQDLSIAKKNRKGLDGQRSGLFWGFVRLLKEVKPTYFVLENVNSMPKEAKELITKVMGVEPIMINSALVSAQQRKRLYWTNILNITQPEDKEILLKDVLELDVNFYGIYSDYNNQTYFDKARCLGAGCGISRSSTFQQVITKPVRIGKIGKGGQGDRVYSIEGKSVNLSSNGGGRGAKTGLYCIPHGYIKEKLKNNIIKYPTLCGQDPSSKHLIAIKDYVRKLTPIECERLQTIPDNYTEGVSNSQRYKMIGNGFTIDVIVHILKHIKE